MKNIALIISILGYLSFLYLQDYVMIYITTMSCLFLIFLSNNAGAKIMAFVYFLYFGLATLNISTYRGTISVETITLYSLLILISFIPFLIFRQVSNRQSYTQLKITQLFFSVANTHLSIVYLCVLLVIVLYGNVFINQEARFNISPAIGYVVKSSLIIPLFYPFFEKKNKLKFFIYVILPILPTIFLGGRGTVIIILGAYLIVNFWRESSLKSTMSEKNRDMDKKKQKKTLIRFGLIGAVILFGLYYIRRLFSKELIGVSMILKIYKFPSTSWVYVLILPLYTGFRETVGISNVIIENEFSNVYSSTPMFFSELLTILPGDHVAPGQVLGKQIIGSTLDGGLTPGILGGLYLDFGNMSILGGGIIMAIICFYYRKSRINNYHLLIFALCFVQFLHLFHRGFLKLEYFTFILLLVIYFSFTIKSKINLGHEK